MYASFKISQPNRVNFDFCDFTTNVSKVLSIPAIPRADPPVPVTLYIGVTGYEPSVTVAISVVARCCCLLS